jgi:hypothetical protein
LTLEDYYDESAACANTLTASSTDFLIETTEKYYNKYRNTENYLFEFREDTELARLKHSLKLTQLPVIMIRIALLVVLAISHAVS